MAGTFFHNAPHSIGSSGRIHRRMRAYRIASLISAFRPSSRIPGTTMPSADFCLLTQYVAMQGAAELVMRRCLFCGSLWDSYPATANGHAGFLVNRVNTFRILLMSLLP